MLHKHYLKHKIFRYVFSTFLFSLSVLAMHSLLNFQQGQSLSLPLFHQVVQLIK
jgi:hypothetical protein